MTNKSEQLLRKMIREEISKTTMSSKNESNRNLSTKRINEGRNRNLGIGDSLSVNDPEYGRCTATIDDAYYNATESQFYIKVTLKNIKGNTAIGWYTVNDFEQKILKFAN